MTWWETVLQFIEHLDGGIKIILGLLATVLILGKKVKGGWSEVKEILRDIKTGLGTLNGREAIRHPDTGAVLAEATMPLGSRMNAIETNQAEMNSAIKLLAENQTRMMKVEDTLADVQSKLEERDHIGQQIIDEWTDWRTEFAQTKMDDHQKMWDEINRLKEAP